MAQGVPPRKRGWLAGIGVVSVAVLAFIGSQGVGKELGGTEAWFGLSLFLPLILMTSGYWLMGMFLKPSLRFLDLAAGILAAQALYALTPAIMHGPHRLPEAAIDIVPIAIGLAWLLARPGAGPLIFLMAYEGFWLSVALYNFATFYNSTSGNLAGVLFGTAILMRFFALSVLYDAHRICQQIGSGPAGQGAR